MNKELKAFLTVRIEEVCSALRHYSFSGSEGLRIVVESSIGGAVLKSYGLNARADWAVLSKPVHEIATKVWHFSRDYSRYRRIPFAKSSRVGQESAPTKRVGVVSIIPNVHGSSHSSFNSPKNEGLDTAESIMWLEK